MRLCTQGVSDPSTLRVACGAHRMSLQQPSPLDRWAHPSCSSPHPWTGELTLPSAALTPGQVSTPFLQQPPNPGQVSSPFLQQPSPLDRWAHPSCSSPHPWTGELTLPAAALTPGQVSWPFRRWPNQCWTQKWKLSLQNYFCTYRHCLNHFYMFCIIVSDKPNVNVYITVYGLFIKL